MRKALTTLAFTLLFCATGYSQALFFGLNQASGAPPATNTFTFVQQAYSACAANPCTVTVSSTGSGHLLVATATEDSGGSVFITSVSGAGSWTVPSGCQTVWAAAGATSCAYNLSSSSGATSISVSYTSGTALHVVIWEYSFTSGSCSLDKIGVLNTTSGSTSLPGPTLSGVGSSDVIIQWITVSATVTGPSAVSGSYGHLLANPGSSTGLNYAGFADLINTSVGTGPSWTLPISQTDGAAAISFK